MTQLKSRNWNHIAEMQKYNGRFYKPSPVICSQFGCGKKLSLKEQLCGSRCTQCMGQTENKRSLVINIKK